MQAPAFPVSKPTARSLFVGVAIALFFTLTLVALAEEKSPPPPAAPASPATAPAVNPTAAPGAAAPATPTAVEPPAGQPAAAPTPDAAPAMRRLDEPVAVEKADDTPPAGKTKAKKSRAQTIRERVESEKQRAEERRQQAEERAANRANTEVVNVFADSHLAAGEKADQVVAVFGSATAEGEVNDQVVAVFGDNRVTGPVHGQVVAVFGSSYINNHVSGDVVVVFGDLELGPKAVIDGEVICVSGAVIRDSAAITKHNVKNIISIKTLWLKTWIDQCFVKARPLAFADHLGWAWGLAFAFLALYVVLALILGETTEKALKVLETRPGFTLVAALLTTLIVPVLIVVLAMTGVGIAAIPFVGLAVLGATVFGKAVILAWVGRRFTRFFGDGPLGHVSFAVLVGGGLVMLLYTVPVLGMLLLMFLSWLGLGVAVYASMLGMKRDRPAVTTFGAPVAAASAAAASSAPMGFSGGTGMGANAGAGVGGGAGAGANVGASAGVAPAVSSGFVGAASVPTAVPVAGEIPGEPGAVPAADVPPVMPPPPMRSFTPPPLRTPPIFSAATLPRAGFWVRLWALGIDAILIGVVTGMMLRGGPLMVPGLAAYAAVMWKFKGTTIGGIICGLKVVRLDDRELDWPTSVVRALGCFLSMAVMGLGFIWVVFDPEKQSWHDKIAGTTVVRMPKGVSLL